MENLALNVLATLVLAGMAAGDITSDTQRSVREWIVGAILYGALGAGVWL